MAQLRTQTVSGTMPAIARDGRSIVLNWEAKASAQEGKETVHVHAWATDEADSPVPVRQFYGKVVSPQLGDRGQFSSHLDTSDFEADVVTFDVPEPLDVGLQIGMRLSEERTRDQTITDFGNINFPVKGKV